ncbi:hypothetical protein PVAND_003902 [Polypedilum vanderplanki]|uniref:P4-ATPase flippase complex beta subunit TMEM30A n=1 Tax=Polypedilum vanderplanki TaxID=319348 RepID=A0A9J6BVI3_POLVA|nr:hypothetical protein PVAND_003902 [Polypedilum vanderplanki]
MNVADIDQGIRIKSKRPSDSNFKQQRLPSWQPILTAGTVLPTFFIIGIAFIPVGVLLLYFSNGVSEFSYNYTNCARVENQSQTCADYLKIRGNENAECHCSVKFQLERDFKGKVFFYYGLTNYYQNHRRYVKSRDDNQLLGEFDSTTSDCAPFQFDHKGQPIVPCGAIANSLFNDTLFLTSDSHGNVPVSKTGIAWPSDKQIKFRNPPGNLEEALKGKGRPIAWQKNLWELDTNPDNNGLQNEDLIVWMRTAALPSFRKLYRRVIHDDFAFKDGLPRGMYTLNITYNYPVTQFDGSKSFIISTTSILGGKNPFLGWAYITVGSICFLLGIVLLIVHLKYRSHAQSSTSNTNQRSPYT